MNLGGPVWHASVATRALFPDPERLKEVAVRQLNGVGDPTRGEWHEWTGHAYHVRRRLSAIEQRRTGLTVVDIRRTPEAAARAARLGPQWLTHVPAEVWLDEIGGE